MSEFKQLHCPNCGGDLQALGEYSLKCRYCDSVFENHALQRKTVSLQEFLDGANIEYVKKQRRNLYNAVCAKYISKTEVHEYATEIKKYLPDDFQANFYLEALSGDAKKINALIRGIDADENYELLPPIFRFLITSLESEFLLELNLLAERAYKKRDLPLYSQTMTKISEEAQKVLSGVYETIMPRDVFIAYSSKDMDTVSKLCEALEEEGFSCFVAARNLRHGVGSVENYDTALREAMDNCTCFLFVSTVNSRKFDCDAVRKEIPYVKSEDIRNAPTEFRFNYKAMPTKYKKPRIEYRIGSIVRTVADTVTNEFFDGYEWVYDIDGVKERLVRILTAAPEDDMPKIPTVPAPQNMPVDEPRRISVQAKPDEEPEPTHTHVPTVIPGRAPTCTKPGLSDSSFCESCGETLKKVEILPATGHSFGEWRIAKKATCTDDGEYERTCHCGERETKKIPSRGGHIPSEEWETVRKPAPGVEGLRAKKCIVCGAHVKEETIPALPLPNLKVSKGLKYKVNEDGKTCTVIGQGLCKDKDIRIPEEIDGYRVTSIGWDAFRDCTSLTSVVIPDSVTSIGDDAFSGCTSLASVVIPDSVTSIGDNAFEDCTSLTSVVIPDSVTSIGDGAFISCTSLASVEIPNSVTSIGDGAFDGCTSLTSVVIPDSVMSIGDTAFVNVGKVEVSSGNQNYCSVDGNLYTQDRKTLLHYDATSKATEFRIPGSVTSIGGWAFEDCTSLASVEIPNSVTSIGGCAFCGCTSLASVEIPNSVTSIGGWAFCDCASLTSVEIPDSVTSIGDSAFSGCTSLASVVIPDSVTSIGDSAFWGCTSLASVVIPDSVTSIGKRAFYDCTSLECIRYNGTKKQWKKIELGLEWRPGSFIRLVECTAQKFNRFIQLK